MPQARGIRNNFFVLLSSQWNYHHDPVLGDLRERDKKPRKNGIHFDLEGGPALDEIHRERKSLFCIT